MLHSPKEQNVPLHVEPSPCIFTTSPCAKMASPREVHLSPCTPEASTRAVGAWPGERPVSAASFTICLVVIATAWHSGKPVGKRIGLADSQSYLHSPEGVNRGSIPRFRYIVAKFFSRFDPASNRVFDIRNGLAAGITVRGAWPEVRNVGDPAFVLGRPEQIDMIVRLVHGSIYRPCSSTRSRNSRT